MLFLKIVSLLFVFILSLLQFRQEKTFIKWGGISLCAAILIIGIADLITSQKDQEYLSSQIFKDSSRISWAESTAQMLLMNDMQNIENGSQQIVFKVIPSDFKFGDIDAKEIIKNVEQSTYGYEYLSEDMAEKLWNAMAEKDGSIIVKKEMEKGIESLYFNESKIRKDLFQGTDVELKIQRVPAANSKYTSLYDLKDKIIVARIVVKTKGSPYIGWVNLNLRSNAGPLVLHFPPKQIVDGKLILSQVRYVGIFLNDL